MKQEFQNDVDMFGVVRDFLTAHAAGLTAVPLIATLRTELGTKIGEIDASDSATLTPITGVAEDKEELRTELEEAVFAVSEPLATFALVTADPILRVEVETTRTGLDRLDASALDAFAGRVVAGATAHLAGLAPYGVVAGMISAITAARAAFAAVVNDPRSAIVERAAHTATIPALIRDVKTRLLRGQLDRLMNRYRLENPVLFAGYRSARTLVNRTGGGGDGGNGGGEPSSSSSSSSSSTLGLPTAPQNVVLTTGAEGSGAAGISWDEPPAGQAVTGFKVYRDGVFLLTAGGPTTLDGFTSGDSLAITVTALNATGEGPASEVATGTAG